MPTYVTRMFTEFFTKISNWSISWSTCTQSTYFHIMSLKIQFNTVHFPKPRYPKVVCSIEFFLNKLCKSMGFSFSHAINLPHKFLPPSFNRSNRGPITYGVKIRPLKMLIVYVSPFPSYASPMRISSSVVSSQKHQRVFFPPRRPSFTLIQENAYNLFACFSLCIEELSSLVKYYSVLDHQLQK
jgi:hypothetical protein